MPSLERFRTVQRHVSMMLDMLERRGFDRRGSLYANIVIAGIGDRIGALRMLYDRIISVNIKHMIRTDHPSCCINIVRFKLLASSRKCAVCQMIKMLDNAG